MAVANSPQLVFGEGKRREAYVPLPDDRLIPVSINPPKMKVPAVASAAPTLVSAPNIMVNV